MKMSYVAILAIVLASLSLQCVQAQGGMKPPHNGEMKPPHNMTHGNGTKPCSSGLRGHSKNRHDEDDDNDRENDDRKLGGRGGKGGYGGKGGKGGYGKGGKGGHGKGGHGKGGRGPHCGGGSPPKKAIAIAVGTIFAIAAAVITYRKCKGYPACCCHCYCGSKQRVGYTPQVDESGGPVVQGIVMPPSSGNKGGLSKVHMIPVNASAQLGTVMSGENLVPIGIAVAQSK